MLGSGGVYGCPVHRSVLGKVQEDNPKKVARVSDNSGASSQSSEGTWRHNSQMATSGRCPIDFHKHSLGWTKDWYISILSGKVIETKTKNGSCRVNKYGLLKARPALMNMCIWELGWCGLNLVSKSCLLKDLHSVFSGRLICHRIEGMVLTLLCILVYI